MKNKEKCSAEMIFILGPTASGKSRVAAQLAFELDGEVISADSMQVYKDMDIITQAASADLTRKVPHHLVRTISPEVEYNAARFAEDAEKIVRDLLSREKRAVFAGGTGLYIKSFLDGIFPSPGKDERLRAKLREKARSEGRQSLHEKLRKIDSETASKVHPNDLRRTIRAIEIYELTGKTKQELLKESRGITPMPFYRMFGLELPREELYRRINERVENMLESGILDEVSFLRTRKLSKTASKALGIKEFSEYLDDKRSLAAAADELKKNSRRYAKRQMTWFRADERIEWISAMRGAERTAEQIKNELFKKK